MVTFFLVMINSLINHVSIKHFSDAGKLTRLSFVVRRISKRRFNLNVYFLNNVRENDLMSVKLLFCHGNDLSPENMK